MGNPNLLPYETIVRATSGEPEAVDEVLQHYSNSYERLQSLVFCASMTPILKKTLPMRN